jgi:hypothetical protein
MPDHSDITDSNCLIASGCEELVPTLVDDPPTQHKEWCENTSKHRSKLADNLLLMSTLPDKPPEKMVNYRLFTSIF